MPDGPLLGNGDVGVVLAGPPEAQRFYISKNDFWKCQPGDSKVTAVACATLLIPQLKGASYRQEQDMSNGEVRGTFTKDGLTVATRSWVQANENLLLTELLCRGTQPASVSVRIYSDEQGIAPLQIQDNNHTASIACERVGNGRRYFNGEMANLTITRDVLNGQPVGQPKNEEHYDGKTTHQELVVPQVDTTLSVAAWIMEPSL
jgi:hypothetical protein